jgi:hypothetical protein
LPQKLAGIGGQGLDVATLTLGEDSIERQRALPGTRQTCQDYEFVTGDIDVDIFEIVLPGATHTDPVVLSHGEGFLAWALGYSGEPSEHTIVNGESTT